MRTFVVGDIHGAGEELQAVIEKAKFKLGEDRLYFVGDLFDRGCHGHLVWSIIKRYGAICTRGNHEQKFEKYLNGSRTGGLPPHYFWALNNLIQHGVDVEEFYEFIKNLSLLVEPMPGVIVTHAGVNVDEPYKEEEGANVYGHIVPGYRDVNLKMPMPKKGDKAPDGKAYWWDQYKGDPLVLYGHLVCENNVPRIGYSAKGEVNSIGLDTAMVHGGPATAYCLETKEVFTFQSGRAYHAELKEQFKKAQPEPSENILKFVEAQKKEKPHESHHNRVVVNAQHRRR